MELPLVVPAIRAIPFYNGVQLGWSSWIELSEERVDRFLAATGERNWLYTDADRAARESPWKERVAPGALLISLIPALLPELLILVGWNTAINSGIERCRFKQPAPVGSRVRMTAQLGKCRGLPGGGCRLPIDIRFAADRVGDAVCTARVIYLYYP